MTAGSMSFGFHYPTEVLLAGLSLLWLAGLLTFKPRNTTNQQGDTP